MPQEATGLVSRIGAIGPGGRLKEFFGALFGRDGRESSPGFLLAALAATDGHAPALAGLVGAEQATAYAGAGDFFAAAKTLDAIFDLRDPEAGEAADIPGGPAVFGLKAARFWLRTLPARRDDRRHADRDGEFWSAVIDRMEDEILILDADCRILECNLAAEDAAGMPRGELLGKTCREIFPDSGDEDGESPEDAPSGESTEVCEKAVATGREARKTVTRMDASGRLAYFLTTAYPVPGPDGGTKLVAVMRRDVSKDVVMERRLQKSERLATIGELSMFISHEIRNPLFAIAGFANALVRSNEIDEASREKASIILSESNRLDGILKSIINFTRPTRSAPGVVDAARAVRDALNLMRVGLDKQGVKLSLEIPPDLPKARGDEDMLKQGLINILKNALEAMPRGGTLHVTAGLDGDMVFVRVEDTGQGVRPEHLAQLFNPFFSAKGKGAGLGLPMTKKILEDMGGSVNIKSEFGRGTAATLSLPPFLALPDERDT